MRSVLSILFYAGFMFAGTSQVNNPTEEFALPVSLNESSGIIYFNNKIITHNDSGGQNQLYELDLSNQLVTRTVAITNATNIDWEDITQDQNYIYIGDIGNNGGDRTDLKIYRISKSDYTSSTSVNAETIAFSYANQTDFTTQTNNTEWDAEALVSFDDTNLMLFSKNWVNGTTKAYLVSKIPGTYSLNPLTTDLNSGGLISGATYNPLSGKLFLVGYTALVLPSPLQPFVWKCEDFTGSDVFSGANTQTSLSASFGFEQTEAITYMDENSYFITSEAFSVSIISDYAKLISFTTNDVTLSNRELDFKNEVLLYPNPVKNSLYIDVVNFSSIEIFDTKSTLIFKGNNIIIDLSGFSRGMYFAKINLNDGFAIIKKIIKN